MQVQSQAQAFKKHSAQSSIEGSNPLTRQWPLRPYRLTKWCNCEVVSLTPCSVSFSLLKLTKLNFSTARNSIKSRLLHLPAEIRNRIFALALGGCHIHVFNNSLIRDSFGSEAFGHTAEIITESTKNREETPLKPKQAPNYVDLKFSNRVYADHNACFHPPNSRQLVKLAGVKPWDIAQCGDKSMTIVGCTCRQIYAETALFYYKLSTFSFGPGVLEQWMENRAEGQKQVIRALHA